MKKHQNFIPPAWMNRPHVLVQNYGILQMIQFGVRRGKEGIAEMKVENFAIKEDDVWGIKTWAKVGLTIHEFPSL